MRQKRRRPQSDGIVVGAGAGFAGDRIYPAVELTASGRCDAVILECLAERTLVAGLIARREDSSAGFDPRLRRRLTPLLGPAQKNGCAVVTNLGSANPLAAAEAVATLATELGIAGLRVAAVLGDDLSASLDSVCWENGSPRGLLGAHAYLGAREIQQALAEGAGVVVTGRVADASLFLGPTWSTLQGNDAVAGATVAGHLLECAAQVTGGNFDPPATEELHSLHILEHGLLNVGYPFARVFPDGSAEVSKLPDTGGRIDRLTCALQLLYEVHDPRAYFTPDAIVDMSLVRLEQTGPDCVAVSGARYAGVPGKLKVVGFSGSERIIADLEITYVGCGAFRRARVAADILRFRLAQEPGVEQLQVDLVGVDSVLRELTRPFTEAPPEIRVHVSALCSDAATALIAEDEVFGMTLNGPAGGCSLRSERRPYVQTHVGWIDRAMTSGRLAWEVSS